MDMIACVKQVPYPDLPVSAYGIDEATNQVLLPEDVPLVISPYDENAVEAGLQLKDWLGGKLTLLSLATRPVEGIVRDLKQLLAMGADDAIVLDDPAFRGGDSWSTAYALAAAIRKIASYDVILCGLQAADWDAGQVGLGVAELLGLPAATYVTGIEPGDGCVYVRRVLENGYERLELPLPCLITVASDEHLLPRIAPLPGIMKAKKKTIPVWSAADLGLDASSVGEAGAKTNLTALRLPIFEGKCEIMRGENLEETVTMLVERLRAARVL